MIKAMLVDDEILAVKMLQKLVDWDRFNIVICATASDGDEAFAAFERYRPDLILTDIGMPRLNGLDFIQKVREINQKAEFILISAHADFGYVQQAMRLGCVDYVLKPIDELELEKTIEKAVERIHKQLRLEAIREREEIRKNKRLLMDYMKTGREAPSAAALDDGRAFAGVRLMSIEITSENARDYERIQQWAHDRRHYAERMLQSILEDCGACRLFDYEDESWLALIRQRDTEKILFCASRALDFVRDELSCTAKICFSDTGETIQSLPLLYGKLLLLRKYSAYRQDEDISGYGYNCEEREHMDIEFTALETQMAAAIRRGDKDKALELLRETLEWSKHINPALLGNIYEFCHNTVLLARERFLAGSRKSAASLETLGTLGSLSSNEPELPSALSLTYARLAAAATAETLWELTAGALEAMGGAAADPETAPPTRQSKIVRQGTDLLRRRYAANVSLDDICRELAISKNYFCYLFKKETGRRIWEYLTEIRMEQAKSLLHRSDLTLSEIAFQVGYDNTGYFSKTFKRLYQMTPNEYRESCAPL